MRCQLCGVTIGVYEARSASIVLFETSNNLYRYMCYSDKGRGIDHWCSQQQYSIPDVGAFDWVKSLSLVPVHACNMRKGKCFYCGGPAINESLRRYSFVTIANTAGKEVCYRYEADVIPGKSTVNICPTCMPPIKGQEVGYINSWLLPVWQI
jgi:hypothetical protein